MTHTGKQEIGAVYGRVGIYGVGVISFLYIEWVEFEFEWAPVYTSIIQAY